MDELITKHLAGDVTDIEARSLERWRSESDENEAHFCELEALWAVSAADEVSTIPATLPTIVREAERRRMSTRKREGWTRTIRSPWTGYAIAAAAGLALLFVSLREGPEPVGTDRLAPIESAASMGDIVSMSLSDGSFLRLAGGSSVEFPPASGERLVALDGRAFFAVAHGSQPFVVESSRTRVTVHGTRFELTATDEELRLVVVEGRVSFEANGRLPVEVRAGEVARLDRDGSVSVVAADDVWALLDWAGGLLLFQETPLRDVATELGRHFETRFEIEPDLGTRRITGWFDEEPLEEVVSAVCLIAGAACVVREGEVTIGR